MSLLRLSQIQASSYNDEFGLETETTSDAGGGYDVGFADNGDWAHFKNINFGTGVSSVNLRTASAGSGGTLEFHLDSVTGALVGRARFPSPEDGRLGQQFPRLFPGRAASMICI